MFLIFIIRQIILLGNYLVRYTGIVKKRVWKRSKVDIFVIAYNYIQNKRLVKYEK